MRMVEADVQLVGARPLLRHPPVFRGRELTREPWVRAAPRRRLTLDDLLAVARPQTSLLLDLKGSDTRLADVVLSSIQPFVDARSITVCGRNWALLDCFENVPGITVFYSAGTPSELLGLLARDRPIDGVSISETLLNRRIVRLVREGAETIVAWTVNSRARARELTSIGVDAIVTDDLRLLDGSIELSQAA